MVTGSSQQGQAAAEAAHEGAAVVTALLAQGAPVACGALIDVVWERRGWPAGGRTSGVAGARWWRRWAATRQASRQ